MSARSRAASAQLLARALADSLQRNDALEAVRLYGAILNRVEDLAYFSWRLETAEPPSPLTAKQREQWNIAMEYSKADFATAIGSLRDVDVRELLELDRVTATALARVIEGELQHGDAGRLAQLRQELREMRFCPEWLEGLRERFEAESPAKDTEGRSNPGPFDNLTTDDRATNRAGPDLDWR